MAATAAKDRPRARRGNPVSFKGSQTSTLDNKAALSGFMGSYIKNESDDDQPPSDGSGSDGARNQRKKSSKPAPRHKRVQPESFHPSITRYFIGSLHWTVGTLGSIFTILQLPIAIFISLTIVVVAIC